MPRFGPRSLSSLRASQQAAGWASAAAEEAGRCAGGRLTHGIDAAASLQTSGRTISLAGVREVSLGTSLSAVTLNHGGSMEGIPPGWTGHRRA